MAVLVVLTVLASTVSSVVTTTVALRIHLWVAHRHHVLTPEERFLQHKTFMWSHPEGWKQ